MEIKREVITEDAGQSEADWSAGLISTLELPEFTPEELRHLSEEQPVQATERPEADQPAVAGNSGLVMRARDQIAGLLLGR